MTPHFLRMHVCCEPAAGTSLAASDLSDVSLRLVDTAAPEQPLFSVTWDCSKMFHRIGQAEATDPEIMLQAAVRIVTRCRGGTGAWAFQQKSWPLGPAFLGIGSSPTHGSRWLQLHVEFDWESALCVALVDRRVEGPLELQAPDMPQAQIFSGCEPTVDQLQIQVVPGVSLAFAELLVA